MARAGWAAVGAAGGAVAAGLFVGLVFAVVWLVSGDGDFVITTHKGATVVMVAFGPDFFLPPCALAGAIAGGVLGWRWARPEPCAGPAVETGTVVRRTVE